MKRIISIFLAFVMTLLLVPCAPAVAENADKLYLNKTGAKITVDDTETLTAILYENGEFCVADNITWESSDESIVTVEDGTITAVAAGNAVITAECGGLSAECRVEVASNNQKLYFEEEWIHLAAKNSTATYSLKGELSENADVTVTYNARTNAGDTSSMTTLDTENCTVTVAQSGLVELTASAMDNGQPVSAKCYISVSDFGLDVNTSIHMAAQQGSGNQYFYKFGYMDNGEFVAYDTTNNSKNLVKSSGKGELSLTNQIWDSKSGYPGAIIWTAPKSGTVAVNYGNVYGVYMCSSTTSVNNSHSTKHTTDTEYKVKLTVKHNETEKYTKTFSPNSAGENLYYQRTEIHSASNAVIDIDNSLNSIDVQKGDKIYILLEDVSGDGCLRLNQSFFRVKYIGFSEDTTASFEDKIKSDEIGKTITNTLSYNGTDIAYYSDDADIAEVSADGSVTVKGEGECRIYAVVDGKAADYYTVRGTAAKKILMNYKTAEITEGETLSLKAAYYTDSTVDEDSFEQGSFTWESSDTGIVTVSSGTVTAIGAGSAKITVTDGEKTAECTVFVNAESSIALSDTDIGLAANQAYTLTAILDEGSSGQEITWASSDTSVAAVDGGTVTASGSGVATITASLADGSSASCVVYCGEVNQEKYHDNSEVGMWKYYYAESGTMNLQEMPEYNVGNKRYFKNSNVFIQQNDMSFDSSYDVFRSWQAPASGTVEISVNNTNRIYGVNADTGAKGEFQLIANGKVVKSVVLESQKKEDGTYYTSTRYNGAGPTVDGNHYEKQESFQNEIGTVTLNVTKGEEIHFAWRKVEGSVAYLGNSSGGFKIKYTANNALYGMPIENDSLSLAAGEISNAAKAVLKGKGAIEDTITYYSDDTSVAEVSGEGAVKGIGTGTATVYAMNGSGTLMDYVEITVSSGDFTVSSPVFNKESDGSVTVSAIAENSGTQERTVIMIAVTRDAQGRPVNVYKSTLISVPADGQEKPLSVSGISCSGAVTIDTYIWESDTVPKPIIDSISKSISQIS